MTVFVTAAVVTFEITLILGKISIPMLHRLHFGQPVRDDGPQSHLKKSGTPTMGGIFVVISMVIAALIFMGSTSDLLFEMLIGSMLFSVIGLIDDVLKVREHNSKGLRAWQKVLMQIVIGIGVGFYCLHDPQIPTSFYIPFARTEVELGGWFVPFCVIYIMAVTNSVNLTDGLDGLAGSSTAVNALAYGVLFMLASGLSVVMDESIIADGTVFSAILLGSTLGFLFYNSNPASVFMGDVGAFLFGGALSMISIITKTELLMIVLGFVYVLSSVSVILQVGSYKLRHKRIFKMAPLHHHFELKGYKETKIVAAYTIVTAICSMLFLLLTK